LMTVLEKDVDRLIGANFPQQVSFDRTLLESQLGADAFSAIDDARELIATGFTFTDADLRKNLAGDSGDSGVDLDRVREVFHPDFTVTQADFLDRINADQSSDADARREFENVRSRIGMAVSLGWLVLLLPLAIAAGIGLLGGRQWASRLAWASTALGLTALIVWISLSVAYGRARPILHDNLTRNLEQEIANKVNINDLPV